MTFDPYAHIDASEDPDAWSAWLQELIARFDASPEAAGLSPDTEPVWTDLVLDGAMQSNGESLATLTPGGVEDVLLEYFPRKVSAPPSEGVHIVRELRAFLAFAERAFGMPHLRACAEALPPGMEERVSAAMADTRKYGLAKAQVMRGIEAGFEMSTDEGLDAWMRLQSAGALPGAFAAVERGGRPAMTAKASAQRKAARKRQKQARRKNRR